MNDSDCFILTGRLAGPPEPGRTPGGAVSCAFRLRVVRASPNLFPLPREVCVTALRRQAEYAACLPEGGMVCVTGKLGRREGLTAYEIFWIGETGKKGRPKKEKF